MSIEFNTLVHPFGIIANEWCACFCDASIQLGYETNQADFWLRYEAIAIECRIILKTKTTKPQNSLSLNIIKVCWYEFMWTCILHHIIVIIKFYVSIDIQNACPDCYLSAPHQRHLKFHWILLASFIIIGVSKFTHTHIHTSTKIGNISWIIAPSIYSHRLYFRFCVEKHICMPCTLQTPAEPFGAISTPIRSKWFLWAVF